MKFLNLENRNRRARGKIRLLLAAAGAIVLLAGLSGNAAAKKVLSIETVNVSTSTFNFEVHPQGGFTGNNDITFQISREEEPRGIAKRCRKIRELVISDVIPTLSYAHIVGRKRLDPPVCNFTNVEISGQPFREQDINAVCFETPRSSNPFAPVPTGAPVFLPGKTAVLEKETYVRFGLSHGSLIYSREVPSQKVLLTANIQCVDNTISSGTPPSHGQDDIIPTGQSAGVSSGGTNWTPSTTTSGADFSGRQFRPVDPRTRPKAPSGTSPTQPAVAPRDPRTRPRTSAGTGSTLPQFTPRDPRTKPGPVGQPTPPAPSCNIAGNWKRSESVYWNFTEVSQGKYEVDVENFNDTLPELPFGSGSSSCIKPTAILSGNTLRFFNCSRDSASFFEGTVNSSCSQVSGKMYNTYGHVGPVTLIRVIGLRPRVPNPNP